MTKSSYIRSMFVLFSFFNSNLAHSSQAATPPATTDLSIYKALQAKLHKAYVRQLFEIDEYKYKSVDIVNQVEKDGFEAKLSFIAKSQGVGFTISAPLQISRQVCESRDTDPIIAANRWWIESERFDDYTSVNQPGLSKEQYNRLMAEIRGAEFLELTVIDFADKEDENQKVERWDCEPKLSVTPSSLARDGTEQEMAEDDSNQINKLSTFRTYGPSESNRLNKKLVTLLESGISFYLIVPIPTVGVDFGYFLDYDTIVKASYAQGDLEVLDLSFQSQYLSSSLQYFIGNSFYVQGGLGYRKLEFSSSILSLVSNSSETISLSSSSFGGEFSLGNQWQWDHFTLGAKWIGYYLPLRTSDDTKIKGISNFDPEDSKDLENNAQKLAQIGHLQLLYLSIGYSF